MDAAGEGANLTDAQRSALAQLRGMQDLRAAVDAALLVSGFRRDDAFKALPWADGDGWLTPPNAT